MPFSDLLTPEEANALRRASPQGFRKGKSRLQEVKDEKKFTTVDERAFKQDVWARDQEHCRKCRRKVYRRLNRCPERGEVHHIHGRGGDLRFESRAALLLCCECHEQVTGRVSEKVVIVATKTFKVRPTDLIEFTDARARVKFQRVA